MGIHKCLPGLLLVGFTLALGPARVQAETSCDFTEMVSSSWDGSQADGESSDPAITPDGRFVTFVSQASNLVQGDSNGKKDVFLYDRRKRTTELVSLSSAGTQGSGDSWDPSISADGRYIAFTSAANDLVADDTNINCFESNLVYYGVFPFCWDIFVRDRDLGVTQRVSVSSQGLQGDGDAWWPDISADGRLVAFTASSSNLSGDDSGNSVDAFVHDRSTGTTERIGVENFSNSISADGRYVAIRSALQYGPPVYLYDRKTGTFEEVEDIPPGWGTYIDYSWGLSTSTDNRYVFLMFCALKPCGLFVRDRLVGVTEPLPPVVMGFAGVSISPDARFVAWGVKNLGHFNDLYGYDRLVHRPVLVSVAFDGGESNDQSWSPSVSLGGLHIAYVSSASNLVQGDANSLPDIFVRQRCALDVQSPWKNFLPLVAR